MLQHDPCVRHQQVTKHVASVYRAVFVYVFRSVCLSNVPGVYFASPRSGRRVGLSPPEVGSIDNMQVSFTKSCLEGTVYKGINFDENIF